MPGDLSFEQLLVQLQDPDWRIRRRAIEDLGELRDQRAFDVLVAALADAEVQVRHSATAALGQLSDPRVFDHLLSQLQEQDNYVAASVLGGRGDARAAPALIQKIAKAVEAGPSRSAADDAMCLRAVESVVMLKDRAAIDVLLRLAKDKAYFMREAAAKALGQMGDSRALPVLLALSGDSHRQVRRAAARALGKLNNPQALEPLLVMLNEDDDDLACAAAEALGELGDRRAVQPLIDRVRKMSSGSARRFAAIAVGKLRDDRALAPLLEALKDKEPDVRCGSAEGLGYLGDAAALPHLESAKLHDEGFWDLGSVRDFAQEAIERIHGTPPSKG